MSLAPIILFAYNRPLHTEQALTALSQNELAKDSLLYIYADGPKNDATAEDIDKIKKTREIFHKKQWCKEVHVIASQINRGLADSVINGTSEIVERHGKVITIEDDVIVSEYFLEYMNKALDLYEIKEKVWMVSGYYWPVKSGSTNQSSFFLPVSTTQAWGTWKRAWSQFDVKATGYEKLKKSQALRKKFNLDNSYDFTAMLMMQMESRIINSWAIRFWWSMFKGNGLILFPDKSLINNIGWDGSGVHCGDDAHYEDSSWEKKYHVINFPVWVSINRNQFRLVKTFHKQLRPVEKISLKNKIIVSLIQIKEKVIGKSSS